MPKPIRGAENPEIEGRIGAKSGAAFRRNHLPLSTESGAGLLRFLQGRRQDAGIDEAVRFFIEDALAMQQALVA
jgi:hypothetical protein